jgi:pimeloyl-ACP methyl ester carboxylesterase
VEHLHVAVSGHPGTQVRVEVHHQDAPIVALFEAGLGLPLEVWHPVVANLPGVCCILTDRPGLGGSTPWAHPPGITGQVGLIGDVLAAVDPARPVTLVGHSYAGILVEAFARVHPHQVRALVLVDPSLPEHEALTLTPLERFPDLTRDLARRLGGIGRWVGWAVAAAGTVGPGVGGSAAKPIARAYADPLHQQSVIDELLAIGQESQELLALAVGHRLPPVPIRILGATRRAGPLPRRRGRWLADLRRRSITLGPTAQVVEVEGAHLLMLDNPQATSTAIVDAMAPIAGLESS